MNGRHGLVVAVAALAVVALGGCGSDQERSIGATPADPPATSATSASTVVTSATTVSTDTAVAVSGTRHTSVATSGGIVEVEGDGASLRVLRLTAADGWTSSVEDADPARLVVTFTKKSDASGSGSVAVDIRLTATGITSSTHTNFSNSSG